MGQKVYTLECEWDMGFNQGRRGAYPSSKKREEALESADWGAVGCEDWKDAEADGLLSLEEIT